ncbi:MAG TPA: DUF4135 domain-containing protein [Ramlibacter sp.]|nr:DUF4135 domain-containing protein [Ramlibacter sp.]
MANRATVAGFNSALRREYGDTIGAALQRRADGHDLSALEIGHALRRADAMKIAQRRELVHMAVPAAAFAHVRAHPDVPPSPEQRESMRLGLDHVMSRVRLPEGPQGRLVAGLIRQNLEAMFHEVYTLDATPDKRLLAELGTKLGERLNDYVLRALAVHMEHTGNPSLTAAVQGLGAGGLAALGMPRLLAELDTEARAFTGSLRMMLSRVDGDRATLGAKLCGGAVPRGLTGLHVTDSDPHKRGQRVCILTFDTGHQAVYKPRDVRIDEAVSGRRPQAGGLSLTEVASQGLTGGRDALPTCTFVPRHDDSGHYGYMEHLSHGTRVDNLVTPEGARAFYRDLGRAAAVTALAGCSDLHHENLMVSGGRPHFIDLEFGFGRGVLEDLEGALGGDPSRIPSLFGSMMLSMAVGHAVDTNPPVPRWRVEGDRLVDNRQFSADVTESLLAVDEGARVRNSHEHELFREHAADFAQGFAETLRGMQGSAVELQAFVGRCTSFQVRYHPISTEAHRTTIAHLKDSVATERGGVPEVHQDVIKTLRRLAATGPDHAGASHLVAPMLQAYAVHDVPYFSREVGSRDLLRDGHEPVPGEYYFPDTPVARAGRAHAALIAAEPERLLQIHGAARGWAEGMRPLQAPLLGQAHRDTMARIAPPA